MVLSSMICHHSGVDEAGSVYSVMVPLSAHLLCEQANDGLPIVVGQGLVASPTRPMRVHVPIAARLMVLEIERAAAESELSQLLGFALPWPMVFEPIIEVSVGAMSSWYRLARRYLLRSSHRAQVPTDPAETRSQQELLTLGLLCGQTHNYTSLLGREQPSRQFEAVRAAVDRLSRHPESVRTVGDLARVSGRSVRCLQEGFRRYLGVTPSEYLRRSRTGRGLGCC
ncbi:AraC-like ligand-binding domain-containing protein [Amycolatopsis alkalitolerans]|uniref:AraC-like ligand-binding domain-containing protein n=1 Tax=Amycolatopsis alkalitolerans TaxID=2547244 RepID=UPI001F23E01E|nr:hypothetical protein [Amycolatopsis alkalitolerans]